MKTNIHLINKIVETNRIYLIDQSIDEIINQLNDIKSRYDDTHTFIYTAGIESYWGDDYIKESYTISRLETPDESQERHEQSAQHRQQQALEQIRFLEEQINRLKGIVK